MPRPRRAGLALALLAITAALLWAWYARDGSTVSVRSPPGVTGAAGAPRAAPPPRLPILLAAPSDAGHATAPGQAAFEGRVVSAATRMGIPGAELTFSRGGAASSVRTGPEGAFHFEPATTGPWLLAAVTAPGYLPFAPEWGHSPVQLTAEAGRTVRGIELHLAPAVLLAGRVEDPQGAPVADAEVRLLGAAAEAALVPVPDRWITAADGTFRAAAPEGAVFLARKQGFSPGLTEVTPLSLAHGRLVIVIGPGEGSGPAARGALTGRVVTRSGGAAVPGALVAATPAHAWGLGDVPVGQATTDADGRFRIADLSLGPYRLEARAEGYAPGRARGVAAAAGEEEAAEIALPEGGRLRGCVHDAGSGAPVAPFTVMVFTRRSALRLELQRALSVIDPSGCYALDDLSPGPAVAVFSAPGRAASPALPVDVPTAPAEAVLDATVGRGGRATGVVRDDTTGAPVAGARVSVEGSLTAAATTFPVLAEAVSGPDGAFVLDGLPARSSLSVAADAHHGRIVGGVEVAPGGEVGPLEVRLRPVVPGEQPRWDLAGVGVGVAVAGDDALVVTQVAPGGGAAEAGLTAGDLLLEVDGRPISELGFAGAVNAIRGPEGTAVVLRIRRDGQERDVTVPRRLVRG